MLFGQDRNQLRRFYCQAWATRREGKPLEPLQAQIVAAIEQHPEYQPLLENTNQALAQEYPPEAGESNPFLHLGMHLAIQEQVGTDRPTGIRELYNRLLRQTGDRHQVEHKLMDCLAEMLWRAQKDGQAPDEQQYLACIRSIAGKH